MTVPPELPIYAQFQPYISRGTQFYLSEEERSYCINELKTIVSKYSNDYEFASALPFYKAALSVLE
ncbi:hypothetical protein ACN4EG_08165 [Alkalinema pantanalense CENA528]|uniref:hypothetical protein n=1 Tax=Alkalinema pantanalense TaxID=1620705 RepID=UPI003D6E2497